MDLPENIAMRAVLFGDRANGGFFRMYANDQLGVAMSVTCEARGKPVVQAWSVDGSDATYPTYEALREAVKEIPATPAAERPDGWPFPVSHGKLKP